MTRKILPETKILLLICLGDLAVTTWLYLHAGQNPSVERNRLMRYFLITGGLAAFYLAKLALTAPALVVLEWYRHKNPVFPARIMRIAIISYLAIFFGGLGLSFIV